MPTASDLRDAVMRNEVIMRHMMNTRRRSNDRNEAIYRVSKQVTRGELLLRDIFRYRYTGHRSDYRALYLEPYHAVDKAPVSMNVPENTKYTLLTNDRTLRFFLPVYAETATQHDKNRWLAHREIGTHIVNYDTHQRIFSMYDNTPLVRLARQYGVTLPRSIGVIRPRQMRTFFNQLQTAIYDSAASDPIFENSVKYDYYNSNETLYASMEYRLDQFLRVSLFAQAYGTALTWAEYKALYAFRFTAPDLSLDSADRWDADHTARLRAQTLILNGLLTGDPVDLAPLLTMPLGLLTDLYAKDENDSRRTPSRVA